MEKTDLDCLSITNDDRFLKAFELFNDSQWYPAHDLFEELWHEASIPYRNTLKAILQIAVAQIHLDRANINGAVILYGEALGKLSNPGISDLGLDLDSLCDFVRLRLQLLHKGIDPDPSSVPLLCRNSTEIG